MLDVSDGVVRPELLQELDCQIQLPTKWERVYFEEKGLQRASFDERRRFLRANLRTKGLMRLRSVLPGISRAPRLYVIYTYNIARAGIAFLHSQQLFPEEICELWLPKSQLPQKVMIVEVVQCTYVGENCYLIGAQLIVNDITSAETRNPNPSLH